MFEWLLLSIALIGTAAAGWSDLRTTEVPDEIPMFMIGIGILLHLINSFITGIWFNFIYALGVGIGFILLGYLFYYAGQWGEADVFILGALGFLISKPLSMFNLSITAQQYFPLIFLFNIFIIGGAYAIVYALIISFLNPKTFSSFFNDVRSNLGKMSVFFGLYTVFTLMVVSFIRFYYKLRAPSYIFLDQAITLLPFVISLFLLYRFAKILDDVSFKKRINTKDLKIGDVLAEKIKIGKIDYSGKLWVGLEKKEIKQIQKIRKQVWIKEGIRFVPVFFFAVLATWLYGDLFIFLISIL